MSATRHKAPPKPRRQFIDHWDSKLPFHRGERVYLSILKSEGRVDGIMRVDQQVWYRILFDNDPLELRYWFLATSLTKIWAHRDNTAV